MPVQGTESDLFDAIASDRGLTVVLTGAGISAASGIPTFRGSDQGAVWKANVRDLGTHAFFGRDPAFELNPCAETIPRCATCGSMIRPHVLWFDEYYADHDDYQWNRINAICDEVSLLIAIGTSFSVGVTEKFCVAARLRQIPVFAIDPNPLVGVPGKIVHVRAKAEVILPNIVEKLADGVVS